MSLQAQEMEVINIDVTKLLLEKLIWSYYVFDFNSMMMQFKYMPNYMSLLEYIHKN